MPCWTLKVSCRTRSWTWFRIFDFGISFDMIAFKKREEAYETKNIGHWSGKMYGLPALWIGLLPLPWRENGFNPFKNSDRSFDWKPFWTKGLSSVSSMPPLKGLPKWSISMGWKNRGSNDSERKMRPMRSLYSSMSFRFCLWGGGPCHRLWYLRRKPQVCRGLPEAGDPVCLVKGLTVTPRNPRSQQ